MAITGTQAIQMIRNNKSLLIKSQNKWSKNFKEQRMTYSNQSKKNVSEINNQFKRLLREYNE